MAGRLSMGDKERIRIKMLEMVKQRQITLKAATITLGVSYRQGKRLYAAYRKKGDAGLIHGNCGKKSNNRIEESLRTAAIQTYQKHYNDFGPTFAAEKLFEEKGIKISVSSLRNILIDAGEWKGRRKRNEHRSRRERRERFGELVQFDGSHHKWFEDRGSSCCLITMIDDATGIRISRFFEQETILGAMEVFYCWINSYGIPEELYCDKKNAFVLTRQATNDELLKGITKPKSHFGRACEKLGVKVIAANSPQAKGRVERNHGIDQDRLVKELRLAGISTIERANEFLEKIYLPKMNSKFSREPFNKEDAHIPIGDVDLKNILCLEYERGVSNDYVVCFENRLFQVLKSNKVIPRSRNKVTIRISFEGNISIFWKENKLFVKELSNTQNQKIRVVA
jgi:transposase